MTWLVICSIHDEAAGWAYRGLRDLGLDPLAHVTDADLLAGAVWSHRLGRNAATAGLRLADGRVVDGRAVRGTLNRLSYLPPGIVGLLPERDREYGLHELYALLLSWLAALPGPILNPPDPRGLCGAWRHPAEWAALAGAAGLSAAPYRFDLDGADAATPYTIGAEDAIVVGSHVFSRLPLSAADYDACRRLAVLARTPLLGLTLRVGARPDPAGVELASATPFPDLRAGGRALLEALAEALHHEGASP
jgi:hypothetical protein